MSRSLRRGRKATSWKLRGPASASGASGNAAASCWCWCRPAAKRSAEPVRYEFSTKSQWSAKPVRMLVNRGPSPNLTQLQCPEFTRKSRRKRASFGPLALCKQSRLRLRCVADAIAFLCASVFSADFFTRCAESSQKPRQGVLLVCAMQRTLPGVSRTNSMIRM